MNAYFVGTLPTRLPEGIRFRMYGGITFLHTPIVASTEQHASTVEQCRANRNATFRKPLARLIQRHLQHGRIIKCAAHIAPSCKTCPTSPAAPKNGMAARDQANRITGKPPNTRLPPVSRASMRSRPAPSRPAR